MPNCYQTDVKTLSDKELRVLSEEIEEAYRREGPDGEDYFLDGEAEIRYYEMQSEIRRRWWDSLTPEQRKEWRETTGKIAGIALDVLVNNLNSLGSFHSHYDNEFSGAKIGSTITVKKPLRFHT